MLSPSPVHMGIDNQTVVLKLKRLLLGARPSKPWPLICDGDLWEWADKLIEARGSHSVRVTKVTGHAAEENINSIQCSEQRRLAWQYKAGNDHADGLATRARKEYGHVVDLSEHYVKRHEAYISMLTKLHVFLVDMLHGEQELREKAARADEPFDNNARKPLRKVLVSPLCFAEAGDSINLHVPLSFYCMHKHTTDAARAFEQATWAFVTRLQIQPVGSNLQGITWIELLILYELRVGLVYPEFKGAAHFAGTPIKYLLRAFKKRIKTHVRECADNWVKMLFKPSKASDHRLSLLGYTHHSAHTSFLPVVSQEEARAISLCVLSLRMKVNDSVKSNFDINILSVVQRKISLHGLPPWRPVSRSVMKRVSPVTTTNEYLQSVQACVALKRKAACIETRCEMASCSARNAARFAISCPRCSAKRSAATANLMKTSAWRSLRCRSCAKTSSSRKWLCPCDQPWHQCAEHFRLVRESVEILNVQSPKHRKTCTKVQLRDAPIVARYRRKKTVPCKPQLKLGPVLAARFPHLAV